MTISFPGSPTNGQIYSPGGGAPTYIYNSTIGAWQVSGASTFASMYAPLAVSPTAPTSPLLGNLWWSTNDGRLYIYGGSWMDAVNDSIPIATTTSLGGVQVGGGLTTDATGILSNALLDVGRNKIHNPLFYIAQRGTGPWTTAGNYTVDRWQINSTLDSQSASQVALSDADRAAIGDEEAQFGLQNVFTGNSDHTAFNLFCHKTEKIPRLSGKTVTVSFYAKATSGTPKLGVQYQQFFGTSGGTGYVPGNGIAVTLSTTWARYSVTYSIPSSSGQTYGSVGDDHTQTNFWFSSGADNATNAGNVGVQSGTVTLWGVQLEVGSVMTPLEKPDPRYDLANCQRFFQYHGSVLCGGYGTGTAALYTDFVYPVPMRALPYTVALDSQVYGNASAYAYNNNYLTHLRLQITVTVTGSAWGAANIAVSAEL